MEENHHDINVRPALQASLIQHTLASWRFFLLFSFPPLLWALFIVQLTAAGMLITLFCGAVWFCCWRLWLDERYFRVISEENNAMAGEVLHVIWGREKLKQHTFFHRQQGALRLFRKTLWLTGSLWVAWLLVGLWMR